MFSLRWGSASDSRSLLPPGSDGSMSAPSRLRRGAVALSSALLVFVLVVGTARPHADGRDPRQFDPDVLADAEVEMWRAYYAHERAQLLVLLVSTLRDQYDLSWFESAVPCFHFARAAVRFARMTKRYETVLPDLEAGYRAVERARPQGLQAERLARAELGWWVARRSRATSSPGQVGAAIARLYSAVFHVPEERVEEAALLRAQAAALRDHSQAHGETDWQQVSVLLHASYRSLHEAVAREPVALGAMGR